MAAIDDLNTAVSALQAEQAALVSGVSAVQTAVTDLVAEVAALQAAIAAGDDAAVEAAATSINEVTSNLQTEVTALGTAASSDPGPQPAPPA